MTRLARALALLLLAMTAPLVATTVAAAPAEATECFGAHDQTTPDNVLDATFAVVCLVNEERQARGLPSLAYDYNLASAAQGHSDWMADTGTFSHVGEGGSDPGDRVTAAGYDWGHVAENIASGQQTPADVVAAWMSSDGHCRNILAPQPVHLGMGISLDDSGGLFPPVWTQVFAKPLGAGDPATDTGPQDACPVVAGPTSVSLRVVDADGTPLGPEVVRNPLEGGNDFEPRFVITNTGEEELERPAFRVTGDFGAVGCDGNGDGVFTGADGCTTVDAEYTALDGSLAPGESATIMVGHYLNASSLDDPPGGSLTVHVDKRVDSGGGLQPIDEPVSARVGWTWEFNQTEVGFDLTPAAEGGPPDLRIDGSGVAVWEVPVHNRGVDAYPLATSVAVWGARGAEVLDATLPGADCFADTHAEDGDAGYRCVLPDGLPAGARMTFTVTARAASAGPGAVDRGAIGVTMAPMSVVASGFEVGQTFEVEDRHGLDDQGFAVAFCRPDLDECSTGGGGDDQNHDGVPDDLQDDRIRRGSASYVPKSFDLARIADATQAERLAVGRRRSLRLLAHVPDAGPVRVKTVVRGTRRGERRRVRDKVAFADVPVSLGRVKLRLPRATRGLRRAKVIVVLATDAGRDRTTTKVRRIR